VLLRLHFLAVFCEQHCFVNREHRGVITKSIKKLVRYELY
jgi:hypothetical protein